MGKRNLNEEALKTNLDATVDKDLVATVSPTYKQAIDDHKEATKNRNEVMKSRETKEPKNEPQNKNDGIEKMHLSESLFEEDEDINDNIVYNLVYNELFGEHNYIPVLGLSGRVYHDDDIVLNSDLSMSMRDAAKIGADEEIIGVRFRDKEESDRKEKQKKIRELAKKLDLPFVSFNHGTIGVIHLYPYIANMDANRFLDDLGISVNRNPIIVTESKKDNVSHKNLKESLWDGQKALEELVDVAKLIMKEGSDAERAAEKAIDDHLIYDEDVINLADYYGAINIDELRDKIHDELVEDIKKELE